MSQISAMLDWRAVWSLCLVSTSCRSAFQPRILVSKGALDKAFKWSVQNGHLQLFREVLKRGKYSTLATLCFAVKHGHMSIVDELLKNNAIYKAVVTGTSTLSKAWGHPLSTAVSACQFDIVNRLLNLPDLDINAINNQLIYTPPLFLAAGFPDTKMLNLFLQREIDTTHREPEIWPPLLNAIWNLNQVAAQAIVDAGGAEGIELEAWLSLSRRIYCTVPPKPLQIRRAKMMNQYAPQLASDSGHFFHTLISDFENFEVLLDAKPDLSTPDFFPVCEMVAGSTIVPEERKLDIFRKVIACGAQPFADTRYPPLLQTAVSNRGKAALPLVEYICSLPGCPPLSTVVAYAGSVEVANFLLDNGAEINGKDEATNTSPLLIALAENTLFRYNYEKDKPFLREIVALLLERGADASFIDASGQNAIQRAARGYADEHVVQMLLDHGAKTVPSEGDTLRFEHSLNLLWDILEFRRSSVVRLLLDNGAAVNTPDPRGRTALWAACFCADAAVLKMLLDAGADVKLGDAGPLPLLHTASDIAENPRITITLEDYKTALLEITKTLLAAGATMWRASDQGDRIWPGAFNAEHAQMYLDHGLNVNETIRWERSWMFQDHVRRDNVLRTGTLLHYAVESHDIDYVNHVLEAGADPSLTNEYGQTPWETVRRLFGTRRVNGNPDPFVEQVKATAVYTKRETSISNCAISPQMK